MSYVASWSGGKDSCMAFYQAMRQGYHISHLVNFISQEYKRVSFHGTEARLVQLQGESLGIPVLQKETTRDGYEQEFKEAVQSLIPQGIRGMVFGDIYLQEHRDWVERVCADLGIAAIEPLWGKPTGEILAELISAGFEAVVVSAQASLIDREWIGRRVDQGFRQFLGDRNIDLCGENGEYHTLVVDGPIFQKRIEITASRVVQRDSYWFLDTLGYRLADKSLR